MKSIFSLFFLCLFFLTSQQANAQLKRVLNEQQKQMAEEAGEDLEQDVEVMKSCCKAKADKKGECMKKKSSTDCKAKDGKKAKSCCKKKQADGKKAESATCGGNQDKHKCNDNCKHHDEEKRKEYHERKKELKDELSSLQKNDFLGELTLGYLL